LPVSLPVSTAAPPPSAPWPAVKLSWPNTVRWLTGELRAGTGYDGRPVKLGKYWEPGEHFALVGPTGEGKTTLAVALLGLRKYVLALDPKGEDETLASSGYRRITGLPPAHHLPRDVQKDLDEGRPVRLIVGGSAGSDAEDIRLRELMRNAITYARHSRSWTVYVDEFEVLSSQRMFGLGAPVEQMLITARRADSSVITSFQAPAWVSKHATRQASFVCVFPTRDRAMIKAVAESMGREWQPLAAMLDEMPPYHVLIIPKSHRVPVVIAKAPEAK
jgi:energy-coupling factor transporter ATP-binding protein EcfA2